ncbi:MAG TPA: dihydrodipicolinate synthase family protein [Planctomycetota bacterium]|nr:dihydrodipicolinate synthase family protein [Planctomycetota bacterium]
MAKPANKKSAPAKPSWRGIIPPLVTPLVGRDELDAPGLGRLVEHILAGGASGIFALGSTGEAPSLSYRLRRELAERVCDHVAGRVPVLVGITDTSFVESVNLTAHSKKAGAAAVVLAPPFYFPAGQPELLEYIQHLAAELALPVFLYNMPSYTKLFFEPDTVRAAAELPNVLGLKDSSGNMGYFHRLRALFADRPDFALLVGPEELLVESVLAGGHGGICGGANLCPELYVAAYQAARAGELAKAQELHRRIMAIAGSVYAVGRHGSSYLKGLKCALSLRGICSDFMAEPFHHFREPEREKVRQALVKLGIL